MAALRALRITDDGVDGGDNAPAVALRNPIGHRRGILSKICRDFTELRQGAARLRGSGAGGGQAKQCGTGERGTGQVTDGHQVAPRYFGGGRAGRRSDRPLNMTGHLKMQGFILHRTIRSWPSSSRALWHDRLREAGKKNHRTKSMSWIQMASPTRGSEFVIFCQSVFSCGQPAKKRVFRLFFGAFGRASAAVTRHARFSSAVSASCICCRSKIHRLSAPWTPDGVPPLSYALRGGNLLCRLAKPWLWPNGSQPMPVSEQIKWGLGTCPQRVQGRALAFLLISRLTGRCPAAPARGTGPRRAQRATPLAPLPWLQNSPPAFSRARTP